MDKYYHFTSFNNIPSIYEFGLEPRFGFRSSSINDTKCAVFLSKGIRQAITMYASMLWFYKNSIGDVGEYNINEYNKSIKHISHILELCGHDNFLEDKKESLEIELNKILSIRNCRNFNEYLGGYGCYLSVDGIDNALSENSENCWCSTAIPTNNINIVYLKNKITGEKHFSREDIISYFMSFFSPMELANGDPETLKQVSYLYEYKNINQYFDYLRNTYDLCEMPFYEYMGNKVKALIFN